MAHDVQHVKHAARERETTFKRVIKAKRLRAGQDHDSLLKVFAA